MNRRLRLAALPLLLLARPVAAQDAPVEDPQSVPKAAPRAPLPPEPKDAGKKAIQAILKEWFESEPKIPVKGRTEAEVKGARSRVVGELETEILKWPGCLKLVSWWKARLEETHPKLNKPTVINAKEEFVFGEGDRRKTYTFATSVPKSYRGNGTDLLPVIVTVIDKGADPKKVFPEVYGKLLDTHIVVASYENNVPNAGAMMQAIFFAHLNYRCDRERITLDGIGKGARFVEELAAHEFCALQWNGAVIRSPLAVQPIEGNLGLFPVAVVESATPQPQTVTAAAQAHVASGGPGTMLPAGDHAKVQDFIAGLPPRKAGDPKGSYEMSFLSTGRMPKWGLWFSVNRALDSEGSSRTVRVGISRDPEHNAVDVVASNLEEGTLYLNDEVLDLDQPVVVRVNGIVVAKEKVVRSPGITFDWKDGLAPTLLGPRNYFVTAVLTFVVPEGDARIPKADREAAAAAEKKAAEDKAKQEEADRLAAEAAKKEAEGEKDPAPKDPETPAPAPPASGQGEWCTSFDDAMAKAAGKPFLVVFAAARTDERQMDLDLALKSEEVVKALQPIHRVVLNTAAEGEEGKSAATRLAEASGAADTKAPYLALWNTKHRLALAGLKGEAEVKAAILRFLELLTEKPPEPAPVEKVPVAWGTDYDAARKEALKTGTAIAALFTGKDDAAGRRELEAALADDGRCTRSLSKLICVRLDTAGEKGAAALAKQKELDGSRTPPILCLVRITANDKGEMIEKTFDVVDPVNLLAEKETFLPRIQGMLAKATTKPETK